MAIKIQGSTIIDDSRKVINASHVGIGTTNPTVELVVDGDARITGILTVGSSSISIDGTNNELKVGTGVTIHHTNGVSVGDNTVHSSGLIGSNLNIASSGVSTLGTVKISSGIVTAVSGVVTYYGDGSNLTGVSVSPGGSDGQIQYNNGGSFGGAAQLYYDDANNRLGINTSSPAYTFDLGESASTIRLVSGSGGTAIRIGDGGGNDITLLRVDGATSQHDGETDSAAFGYSFRYLGSATGNDNKLQIVSDNQTGTAVQAFTMLQDGNIGIANTTPSTELDVGGTITATNYTGKIYVDESADDNAEHNLVFIDTAYSGSGDQGNAHLDLEIDSGGITFNPSTNTLTVANIIGDVTGDLTGIATGATRVYVDESEDDNANYNLMFSDVTPGVGNEYRTLQVDNNGIQFNPSPNHLKITGGTAAVAIGTNRSTNINASVEIDHGELVGTAYTNSMFSYNGNIRITANDPTIELIGSDSGNHAASIYMRNLNEGYAFINNPTTEELELKSFTASANAFYATSSGGNVSSLNTLLRFGKDGNIGVGDIDAAFKLDVDGAVRVSSGSSITFAGPTTTGAFYHANNADTTLLRVTSNGSTANLSGDYGFTLKYLGSGTGNDNKLQILSDNQNAGTQVQAFTMLQDGKIGIANTAPTSTLDVDGTLKVSGIATAQKFVVEGGSSTGFLKADGSIDSSPYATGTGTLDSIVIKDDGQNVGSASTFTSLDFYNGIGVSTTGVVGVASISLEDNISISGIFTAASFSGSGSGLTSIPTSALVGLATDADKLDGQDGTYYLNYSNFSGIATDSDKLDGQDGTYYLDYSNFSGIATDSDKLDGIQASSFLRSDVADTKSSGDLTFSDNIKLNLGSGGQQDSSIYHNGTDARFDNRTGDLILETIDTGEDGAGADIVIKAGTGKTSVLANVNGAVELWNNGSKKFETTGIGVSIVGTGNTATITGPSNLVLDPAAVGDATGTVTILGNLQVDGTQTVINSTTMTVDDLNIVVASGATNASAANGAGITVDGASATLTYSSTADTWVFNKAPYYNTDRLLTTADEGSGNGLDADKLDGQQGTYYLNYSNFSGIATDSDKLDGQQGTYYLDYTNFSGIATDSDKLDGQEGTYYLNYSNFSGIATDSDKLDGQEGTYYLNYSNFSGIATDSDKLDGIDSTSFLRSDALDIKTSGSLRFDPNVKLELGSTTGELYYNNTDVLFYSSTPDIRIGAKAGDTIFGYGAGAGTSIARFNNAGSIELNYANNKKFETTTNGISVSGIVTAISGVVTYYGDGSGLTNVSVTTAGTATTATNVVGTANRVLYNSGTDTTTTSANLTFDGSVLGVAQTANINRITAAHSTGSIIAGNDTTGVTISGTDNVNNVFIGVGAGQTNNGNHAGYNNVLGYQAGGNLGGGGGGIKGYNNIMGYQAGQSLFTGSGNPTGYNNILGYQAGKLVDTAAYNNVLGYQAGQSLENTTYNNLFGYRVGNYLRSGAGGAAGYNNVIGYESLLDISVVNSQDSGYNNFIGYQNAYVNQLSGLSGYNNGIGFRALYQVTGRGNNAFGWSALYGTTSGGYNIGIGFTAGGDITSGSRNIAIGYDAQVPSATGSDQLAIGSNGSYWVLGDSSYNVGIGTDTINTAVKLTVGGGVTATTYYGDGSQLTGISAGSPSPWITTGYTGIGTTSAVGIGTIIEVIPYDTQNNGTLSFEGSAGQLFSITNNLTTGSIFSVNDVSGIPSIDVDADGTIQLAPFGSTEFVGIGTTNPTAKLDVNGTVALGSSVYDANGTFGTDGQVLSNVTGFGVSWTNASVGGGSVAGSDGQIQYNNGGSFGGAAQLYYDDTNNYVGINSSTPTSTLDVDGTLNVTGIVTATSFSGSGSNLTDVAKLSGQQLYSSGDLRFADDGGIYFGTGYDMYILHYTGGAGTSSGNIIRGSNQNLTLDTVTSGDILIKPVGSVELYENNSKKFETTGDGVNVTGILTATSEVFVGSGADTVTLKDGSVFYNNYTSSKFRGNTLQIDVKVISKSTHRYSGGSTSAYEIDGVEAPFLTFVPGMTYRFGQSDASNATHPLRFYLDADKTTEYTEGVTTAGTPGSGGAYTQITINEYTPNVLYYQCSAHDYMGNAIQTHGSTVVDGRHVASPNATVPVHSLSGIGTETNIDVALVPKGTGAILGNIPDGASTGGNKRGPNAVDLQTVRGSAAKVASGNQSVILGGSNNEASGTMSGVINGQNNISSSFASISGGSDSTSSGDYSVALGYVHTADSNYSCVLGGSFGTARGIEGNFVTASHAGSGYGQKAHLIVSAQTTNATQTTLTANGATTPSGTNQVTLPNNAAYAFKGTCVAGVTGAGNTKAWEFRGVIKRGANAASTTLVGSVIKDVLAYDTGAAAWDVDFTADTTNGALQVKVTGQASTTIRWVCSIETTEMTF